MLVLRFQFVHQLFESFAAVFKTAELVEARACGRKQNRVARGAMRECMRDGGIQRLSSYERNRAIQLPRDFRCCRSNQQGSARPSGASGTRSAE